MQENFPDIRTIQVTRYVTPLREGGSLPAIAEGDDDFLYVLKFRGAGQGIKALIAELIGGELARYAALNVPEIVFAALDEAFGRTEPDEEIQDLLKASTGLNIGLHFLSGAITYDIAANIPDAFTASKIVWLDAYLMNVDRTPRNSNMLLWNRALWLIDHGAALYFHHNWANREEAIGKPFVQVKDHLLLPFATQLDEADRFFKNLLTPDVLHNIVETIPQDWLENFEPGLTASEIKDFYKKFLIERLINSDVFLTQAKNAGQ